VKNKGKWLCCNDSTVRVVTDASMQRDMENQSDGFNVLLAVYVKRGNRVSAGGGGGGGGGGGRV
jgi:hypothetical protein